MEKIIRRLVDFCEREEDYEVADIVEDLLHEFTRTINCPSTWRNISEEIANEHKADWLDEAMHLWNFRDEDYEYDEED